MIAQGIFLNNTNNRKQWNKPSKFDLYSTLNWREMAWAGGCS